MRNLHRPEQVIENWFDIMAPAAQATAREAHALVLATEPRLFASIKWGQLVYAWLGTHTLALAPFKGHLHLQVFHGSAIERDLPALRGRGRGMRFIELRHGAPLDAELLATATRMAVDHAVRVLGKVPGSKMP